MMPIRDDNPVRGIPVVTIVTILACMAVYLWQISLPVESKQTAITLLGFMPALLFGHATIEAERPDFSFWGGRRSRFSNRDRFDGRRNRLGRRSLRRASCQSRPCGKNSQQANHSILSPKRNAGPRRIARRRCGGAAIFGPPTSARRPMTPNIQRTPPLHQ